MKDELNNALTARDALKGYADWAKEELIRLRAALDAAKQRAELTEGLLLKCDEAKQEAERLFISDHDKLIKWIERAEVVEQLATETKAHLRELAEEYFNHANWWYDADTNQWVWMKTTNPTWLAKATIGWLEKHGG